MHTQRGDAFGLKRRRRRGRPPKKRPGWKRLALVVAGALLILVHMADYAMGKAVKLTHLGSGIRNGTVDIISIDVALMAAGIAAFAFVVRSDVRHIGWPLYVVYRVNHRWGSRICRRIRGVLTK